MHAPRWFLLAALVGVGCRVAGEEAESAHSADTAAPLEALGTYADGVATVRTSRYALAGYETAGLVNGKRYMFKLEDTSETRDGLTVKRLASARAALTLVGTLEDDANDPETMHLKTAAAKDFLLHGDTALTYKDIRSSLPEHDYKATLFKVLAIKDAPPDTRWEWISYEPIPLYECTQTDQTQVHLDLVSVKPDDSLLDGTMRTEGGPEAIYGAHALCRKEGTTFTCALDRANEPWGTASFVPSASGFEISVEATATKEKSAFRCTLHSRAEAAKESEN